MIQNLNTGWLFHYIEGSSMKYEPYTHTESLYIKTEGLISSCGPTAHAWDRGFDDSTWQKVVVPHDWAVTMPFSKEYSSGTGYLAGGIGWYRLHFKLPKEMQGQSIRLVFDGVYKHSQVWCNSYYLGKWENGYTNFSYDITQQVRFGEEDNVIAVKVSHPDIADSRWYTGSGITRNVSLVISEAIHIEKDSVFFTTELLPDGSAQLHIDTTIVNTLDTAPLAQEVKLTHELLLPDGKEVLQLSCEDHIASETTLDLKGDTYLSNPLLWSIDSPFLYTLKSTLYNHHGQCLDEVVQKVGIRDFILDTDTGFYLNGENMKLKGVCLHEDAGCLGNAVPKNVWQRRLKALKEMGANAVRMSHNPHAAHLYELCDEMGFLVIDEIYDEWEGPKNKWSTGHNVYPPKHQGYFEDFWSCYEKDVKAFVRKTRNHPSVIMWSIGNEIDYPNDPYCHPLFQTMTGNNDANKPAAERMYNPNHPSAERLAYLAKILSKEVKKHDTTRPITIAAAFPELSSQLGFFDSIDVIGYNYKEHLYDEDHKRFPQKPLLGSENGHDYRHWKTVLERPFIAGQFLWTGVDYLGEAKGWPVHGSSAGLLTLAGYPKGEYYFRQSLWSEQPVLHMLTARKAGEATIFGSRKPLYHDAFKKTWNYATGEIIEVRVFTNEEEVSLILNNHLLATKKQDLEVGYISFDVPFESGELKAVTKNCEYTLKTTGYPCTLAAQVYDQSFPADGTSLLQLEVTVVDEQGHEVTNASPLIEVKVDGNSKLAGIENGDLADVTPYPVNYRRAYRGKLLVFLRSTQEAGDISITLTGEGLKPIILNLSSY